MANPTVKSEKESAAAAPSSNKSAAASRKGKVADEQVDFSSSSAVV